MSIMAGFLLRAILTGLVRMEVINGQLSQRTIRLLRQPVGSGKGGARGAAGRGGEKLGQIELDLPALRV